jgi:NAD(P)-dependent dehydrogenase (short-subunit alcohol dehydrogenase family)
MLATSGYRVAILDRDGDRGTPLATQLGGVFLEADVTDAAAVERALDRLEGAPPLRALVHCAGIGGGGIRTAGAKGGTAPPHSLEIFRRLIEVNLIGTFNCARLAAARMIRSDPLEHGARGVIVLTSSIAAADGPVGSVAYCASKAGVEGLTLPMARDLGKFGIRVVTIAPGLFDTPLAAEMPAVLVEPLLAQQPFPKAKGEPEAFGRLVLEICRNPMLNGCVLRLDGGLRLNQTG